MAGTLPGLSVAANIIQLLDFSIKFLDQSSEIYRSQDGATISNTELGTITTSLERFTSGSLWAAQGRVSKTGERTDPTAIESQFEDLCRQCNSVADELLVALRKLKKKCSGRKWSSIRQAFQSIWSEDEIDSIEMRLARYRAQIDTVMLGLILEKIEQKNATQIQKTNDFAHLSRSILEFIDVAKTWQVDLVGSVQENHCHSERNIGDASLSAKVAELSEHERDDIVKLGILVKLDFPELSDRAEQIPKPYQQTFNWIYHGRGEGPPREVAWDDFSAWLKSRNPLYWITGKPGSGKSTLMKYLYHNPRTIALLQEGQPKCPIIASFFFWNSGSPIQRSRHGLGRTLLYQVLNHRPELIPISFPEQWRRYKLFGEFSLKESWNECCKALFRLVENSGPDFFFFIDGLDEFDGNCADLADFIIKLSTIEKVKLCVSSRPWLVFEDKFNHRPHLRLETLTRNDIHHYVSTKIGENAQFGRLRRMQPQKLDSLTLGITEKAQGVFLWVYLVVSSLLTGLRDGDKVEDLQARLVELPSTLEDLFKKILGSLEPTYFAHASRLFQLHRALADKATVLRLFLADEGPNHALEAPITVPSMEEKWFMLDTMKRRLMSRCRGFLEVPEWAKFGLKARVMFLHRTVNDFFQQKEVWDYIVKEAHNDEMRPFDINRSLCGAYLGILKGLHPVQSERGITSRSATVQGCIRYASKCNSQVSEVFLDELDRTGREVFGPELWKVQAVMSSETPPEASPQSAMNLQSTEHESKNSGLWNGAQWTKTLTLNVDSRSGCAPCECFIELMHRERFHDYVQSKILNDLTMPDALLPRVLVRLLIYYTRTKDLKLVQKLFDLKTDPNAIDLRRRESPWQVLLKLALKGGDTSDFIPTAASLYIANGADLSIRVEGWSAKELLYDKDQRRNSNIWGLQKFKNLSLRK